ncbi:MAG TPA: Xaa-Pro peptidase family protein [Candidatus Bathyarchaeia archaeon]|nr:Xaa-Pro peptidase family protein [Candidatus Bathyarchaeia archaeon]
MEERVEYHRGSRANSRVFKERVKRANTLMEKAGLDAILLTKPQNMMYLVGDGRLCAFAIVAKNGSTYVAVPKTDLEDVKKTCASERILGFDDEVGMLHSLMHIWKELDLKKGKVGVENTFLRVSMLEMFKHPHAKPPKLEFADATSIMTDLRIVKSREEVELLRNAAKVADSAMDAAINATKAGVTETEIAAEAEYMMRKKGAEEFFRTYVASGPRSSIAHGVVSLRKVQRGDLVMIDIHPTVNAYHADLCRTISVGKASEKQRKAFKVYMKAQRAAVEAVGPDATMTKLENIMHEVFEKKGYEAYFLGPPIHGVGLEFEEPPLPAGHAFFHGEEPKDELKPGMVISIGNCGLYLGNFGVRVEDTVAVTGKGYDELTKYNRALE